MAEHEPLEILVDTDVQVASSAIPRRVVETLRRQLRQLDAGAGGDAPLALLTVREGRHRMPQALLPRLTEACRKQGVPFSVVDRRANVACPPLRSRLRPPEREREVVRRLLLRDSGVVVVEPGPRRALLAAELCARRQQRTLIVTEEESERWCRELRDAFGLEAPLVAPLRAASAESRIVVGRYRGVLALAASALREGFGLVIFDGVDRVDAVTLMNIVRGVGARYLLGLAGSASRADGLESPLYLALGGIVDRLEPAAPAPAQAPPRLALRLRASRFAFPTYEGRDQYQALLAALAVDAERARLVAEDIAAEAAEGRACLVLSERRDHLEQLGALLPEAIAAGTLTSAVRPAERARIAAAFEAGELRVLLASGQIAADALPIARAESLVLGFPFAYARKLEPTVRALLQPSAAKGERGAVRVYDYDDPGIAPLHRAFEKRRAFLEKLARELEVAAAAGRQLALPIGG